MAAVRTIGMTGVVGAVFFSIVASMMAQEDASQSRNARLPAPLTELDAGKSFDLPTAPMRPRFVGTGSCSAVACHGSFGRKDCGNQPSVEIWRSEYTVWMTDDPHRLAFDVLHEPLARRIAENLASGKAVIAPDQDLRCLACHTAPRSESDFASTSKINADGVGCESCHGPAADWIGPHTSRAWRNLDSRTKESQYGFRNTKNLLVRTETCLGCHLGRRGETDLVDRDMNHDMIAAGHPRLNFEMASYSELQPAHWCEKPGQWSDAMPPGFSDASAKNAWLWVTGRLATAAAAFELSAARAESRLAPWPEFSESDCNSCHQALTADPVRKKLPRELAGSTAWGSWHLPGLNALIPRNEIGEEAADALRLHSQVFAESLVPDRRRAVETGRVAADRLRKLAIERNAIGLSPQESFDFVESHIRAPIETAPGSWDREAQKFLAVSALARAYDKRLLSPEVERFLERLRLRLESLPTQGEPAPAR
jgi:hypothetical protein